MFSLLSLWAKHKETPWYNGAGGVLSNIEPYLEIYAQNRPLNHEQKFRLSIGADVARHIAFVFDDMACDVDFIVKNTGSSKGARAFACRGSPWWGFPESGDNLPSSATSREERNAKAVKKFRTVVKDRVHFVDFGGQFLQENTEIEFGVPDDVLAAMYDAAHVLPRVLMRIIADYCLDPRGSLFAIGRLLLTRIRPDAGPLVDLPTETVIDPWTIPYISAGREYREKELSVNQNVVTDLVWTPGTAWGLALNGVAILESPRNARSERILAEFSGGLGRMHVGHLPVGCAQPTDWRLRYHPNWWGPLEYKSETKAMSNTIGPGDPAKIEEVHEMLRERGMPEIRITRMALKPISVYCGYEEYLVFVEPQDWCPLFNSGYPKAIGYNNTLYVNWETKETTLKWRNAW